MNGARTWYSELKAAEAILTNKDVTLGFDAATTQEGRHVNSVHIATKDSCFVLAIDELPGGTAEDFANHICQAVDNIATT